MNINYPLPQQGAKLVSIASLFTGTAVEILSQVHCQTGYQQGCQGHPVEVSADESGKVECLPAVCTLL